MTGTDKKNIQSVDLNLEDINGREDKYLTFQIAKEEYGISIVHVTEIVGLQHITQVPDMPAFVRGVINLRGNVIPIIDVRARFQMPSRDYDDRTCVVVVNIREVVIGLIVDTVNEVIDILPENISPPPQIHSGTSGRFLQGLGRLENKVIILLAVDRLLFDEELKQIEKS